MYTGKCDQLETSLELDFQTKAKYLMTSIKTGVSYQASSFQNFKNVNIYIKTRGGSQAITSIISQNSNGQLDNVSFNYEGWLNSVTENTESLIGIGNPDTRIYLISEFIDDPIKRREVESAMSFKSSSKQTLISTSRKDFLCNYGGETYFGPPSAHTFNRALIRILPENNYYKIKAATYTSELNLFLSSSGKYTSPENNESQKWELHYNQNGNIKLQNIQTGLYLSAYDLKFYSKPSINDEEKFLWEVTYF